MLTLGCQTGSVSRRSSDGRGTTNTWPNMALTLAGVRRETIRGARRKTVLAADRRLWYYLPRENTRDGWLVPKRVVGKAWVSRARS